MGSIDLNRKYRTRDGREVRLYALDGDGASPIHGAAKTDGQWRSYSWSPSGNYLQSHEDFRADLVEVKAKHEGWINLYAGPMTRIDHVYGTAADAENAILHAEDRIATIRIEWEA